MNEELKTLIEQQGKAFDALKEANDRHDAEIKKFGQADVVTKEKLDKLAEDLAAKTEAVENMAKVSGDLQTAFTKAMGEFNDRQDQFETALKRIATSGNPAQQEKSLKEQAAFLTVIKGDRIDPEKLTPEDVDKVARFVTAQKRWLRRGQAVEPEEVRDLSVGIDADGGYWVLPEIDSRVRTRLFETSPMRSVAEVITIGTDAFEFPTDTNDAVLGGWVGETDARAVSGTPQVGTARIPVHEHFARPQITQKLLDDSQFSVETWLANKLSDRFVRTENATFVSGDGTRKPRGFLDYGSTASTANDNARNWGVLQYVPSGAAANFDFTGSPPAPADVLIDLVHKLNPAYRAGSSWMMNRATLAEIRKLKDGQGNYLWSMGDIQRGQPQQLLAFTITEAEDMPAIAANSFPIAFGNWRTGYLIIERQGTRTLRDPFTNPPYVRFYTTRRVGGDVQNFDSIKLLKMATT